MSTDTTSTTTRREQLLEQLATQSDRLRTSDGWVSWLDVARKFRTYSVGNQLLIQAQCPHATRVAGFRTWRELGRTVKKGEHGIGILAPMVRKAREGETPTEGDKVIMGFRVVFVFDVSQTLGPDLPEMHMPSADVDSEDILLALVRLARARGYTVLIEDDMDEGHYGQWIPTTATIRLSSKQTVGDMTSTMLHELAHSMDPVVAGEDPDPMERELVAESAAYIIGTELGVRMDEASTYYVMTYGATKERLLDLALQVMTVAERLGNFAAQLQLELSV